MHKKIKVEDYLDVNKKTWNNKVKYHVDSEFYGNQEFVEGKSSLNSIEFEMLNNIENKSALHLQCHFGQDTISLTRLGARAVGVDLSDKAIEVAKTLAKKTDSAARFICSDIYNLPNQLDEKFDFVFTTYGTIGWLPDLDKWAKVINHFLKPGGQLIFVEFHPVVWMFDDNFSEIKYAYFKQDPIIETEEGTYADTNAPIVQKTITWNHGLGEVVDSLLSNSMLIEEFKEYDYSPYNCFNGTIEIAPGKFRIEKLGDKIPMVYAIKARKK